MPSSGFGFPASKVNAPSPKKADLEEKTVVEPTGSEKEVDPLTATAIILPEFEGEEMIGDGELPDLVKVVLGKDSTPDFEEEERKLMVEEKGPKGESIPVTCAESPVADVAPMVTPTKSPKRAAPVNHATPRNSMADFSLLCATPGQSEDDAIRQELLWQQQLLERDKEIHEKEKLLQRMQTEIAEAEMKKVMDGESNRQMM